jgi:hypothetical protein
MDALRYLDFCAYILEIDAYVAEMKKATAV